MAISSVASGYDGVSLLVGNAAYNPFIGARGVFGGGMISGNSYSTGAEYVTIATTGNATSFGDLTVGRWGVASLSNGHGGL